MKTFLTLLIFSTLNLNVYACLNGDSKTLKGGSYLYEDYFESVPRGHLFYKPEAKLILKLDSLFKATKDVDYLSDKGYVLIVQGKYEEAIQLYLGIEKAYPNRYSTASNIGTAYELSGQNEKALQWIKKAIMLDPSSHHSSEWIHVNILAAKINQNDVINSDFLLQTSFGNAAMPITTLPAKMLDSLKKQLFYQLNERVSFVKPKDIIVATLYFDFGNMALLKGDRGDAKNAYILARDYGYNNFSLLRKRMDAADGKKPEMNKAWIYWCAAILLIAILFFFWMKNKANR